MRIRANKSPEDKSQAVASQENTEESKENKALSQKHNLHRPSTIVALQGLVNESHKSEQIAQLQGIVNTREAPQNKIFSGSTVIQRTLNTLQRDQLDKAQKQFESDKKEYKTERTSIAKVEQQLIIHEKKNKLDEFQVKIKDAFSEYDKFFSETEEIGRRAHLSSKAFETFTSKVNQYNKSGLKNKLLNLIKLSDSLSKELPKQNQEEDDVPSVLLLKDYIESVKVINHHVNELIKQKPETTGDLTPIKDVLQRLKIAITNYYDKKSETIEGWPIIVKLHQELQTAIVNKKDLHKDGFEEFLSIHLVDKKSSQINTLFKSGDQEIDKTESQKVGLLNVASRSLRKEGKYMRSQYDHEGNESGQGKHQNPLGERMKPYMEDGAKDYNIGGSKMIVDKMLEQRKLRPKKRNNSPEELNALRDDIIDHKNKQVTYIVDKLKGYTDGNLFLPEKQLDANYPCVLILFSDKLLKEVDSNQTNIPEFLTHFLIGHVNRAIAAEGVRPLIERRQSFGFMTPTMTDVHSGIRLSMGVTPSDKWNDAVIKGILAADKNIGHIKGFENLGDKDKPKEAHITMNKFNQGSVLGAGHRLITKILENNPDIKPEEIPEAINEMFGRKDGEALDKLLNEISDFKDSPGFKEQEISDEATDLLDRLKSFYENYIATTSGKKVEKGVKKGFNWKDKDPAEELQKMLDQGSKATYQGGRDIAGLDETSDEEDEQINRTPSGMSALAVPVVAYREAQAQKDSAVKKGEKSVVYDAAPFSYFEIDMSWKGTFNIDFIERSGARYPLFKNKLKAGIENTFECHTTNIAEKIKKNNEEDLNALEETRNSKLWKIDATKRDDVQKLEEAFAKKDQEEIASYKREKKPVEKTQLAIDDEKDQVSKVDPNIQAIRDRLIKEEREKKEKVVDDAKAQSSKIKAQFKIDKKQLEAEQQKKLNIYLKEVETLNGILRKELRELFTVLDEYMSGDKTGKFSKQTMNEEPIIKSFVQKSTQKNLEGDLYTFIVDAFKGTCFTEMSKAKEASKEDVVEVAYVDVNPCMTGVKDFDGGAALYEATLKKYKGLRMIVLDITSSTEKQVKELIATFQSQEKTAVPFLCLAKSSTKHDQMGLDISTMGKAQYIMNQQYKENKQIVGEFANLQSASRKLAQNTEPPLVKKMRRDMKRAARSLKQ